MVKISMMRSTLLATAVAASLSLVACGDGRNDSAATRSDTTVASNEAPSTASTSTPYATDRATADASSAAARSGTDTPASNAAATADKAGDRAADAAGDAATTAKVKAALMAEPGIQSLQIDVDTSSKRVTLSGEVDTADHRQRALTVARSVEGVAGVVDRLTVKR